MCIKCMHGTYSFGQHQFAEHHRTLLLLGHNGTLRILDSRAQTCAAKLHPHNPTI